jgi:uncharacterized protein (DUF2147 family)
MPPWPAILLLTWWGTPADRLPRMTSASYVQNAFLAAMHLRAWWDCCPYILRQDSQAVMGTLRHILQSFVQPCMQSTALAALFGLSLASMPAAAAQATPPVGQWLTEDRSGVIAISPCGGALCGRIVGMAEWPTDGTVPVDVHGRPECGLTIISDAKLSSAGRWDSRITDPDTGRIYNAQLWVDQAGRLHLHGYIGLPLFGMTQVWTPYPAPVPPNCRLS